MSRVSQPPAPSRFAVGARARRDALVGRAPRSVAGRLDRDPTQLAASVVEAGALLVLAVLVVGLVLQLITR